MTAPPVHERRDRHDEHEQTPAEREPEPDRPQPAQRLPQRVLPAGASVVDLDDEDPGFYELDGQAHTPYRRAVGE